MQHHAVAELEVVRIKVVAIYLVIFRQFQVNKWLRLFATCFLQAFLQQGELTRVCSIIKTHQCELWSCSIIVLLIFCRYIVSRYSILCGCWTFWRCQSRFEFCTIFFFIILSSVAKSFKFFSRRFFTLLFTFFYLLFYLNWSVVSTEFFTNITTLSWSIFVTKFFCSFCYFLVFISIL